MRKLFIFLLSVSLTSVIFALSSGSALALSAREVLGDSTVQQPLSIPPTAEGPGLVLPNSPLFFLDLLKQDFRLLLAFTPEQKAKIHNSVAGERLAELQIMLAKDNVPGIRIALQGVSDNLKSASEDVVNAKLTGRNITLLAEEINTSIKEKQKVLSALELLAGGEIKAQVQAAVESLQVSKIAVEDNLPADLLVNEIGDDLNLQLNGNINNAKISAAEINHAIDVLTRLASEAAASSQQARQEALTHAIDVKNLVAEFQKASVNLQKEILASPRGEPTLTPTPKSTKK